MDSTKMAAPLYAALVAKGYENLTPVQDAVLADELLGRDLLVSAQTGSGKTVAFGLAMAPEVLDGMDKFLPADKPLALVIAPTRELALQVERELVWLYSDAVVASCVGGMDYRTEKRTLERGAHIVVGTPGRLRDHVERKSLDLSELRVVVLDEADEMLDMGFSDDLEFLLGRAPEEKRVLMFSATVPKEIASLAATYQRDARRVEVKSSGAQHSDIEYQAISVSNRDKEPAIFNLVRWHDARVAIIFCKTRANVNLLHSRMVNRGFPVVALSGELSQTERLHALQALRDGRARVCIATDVAARGIDLPGLDLVIHADIPSNPETLLHRSGRTGRAGRKGTSVLVASPADFRKASRMLQGAKVVAEWVKAPGADAVLARENERLMNDAALTEAIGAEANIAADILAAHSPEAVAAAFVRLWRAGRSHPEDLAEDLPAPAALPPRERGEFGASVWYKLNVGHSGRAEARWLLPKICDAGGIAKDGIGAIRVQQDFTFVQIAEQLASRFKDVTEIEPGLEMQRIAEAPEFGPTGRSAGPRGDSRGPRAPREDRGPRAPRGDFDGERKSFPKKSFGDDRKPYGKRDEDGGRPARSFDDRKPRFDRDGERSSAPRRDFDDKKPRWNPDAPRPERGERSERFERPAKPEYKSAGFRSHGSTDKPARSGGFKSHGASEGGFKRDFDDRKPRGASEGRPYAKRDDSRSEGKTWAPKSGAPAGKFGDKKPFVKGGAARPASNARDTSARFTPPKKR